MYLHYHVNMHLQEQIEEQKREINQLNHKLRNRQQDVGKSMSRYTTHKRLYDRNEQEHQSTTAMKAETITSQRIQKLEQENQTLKTQVEDTRQALQDKEVSPVRFVYVHVQCVWRGTCACTCTSVYPHMYIST